MNLFAAKTEEHLGIKLRQNDTMACAQWNFSKCAH